MNSTYKITVDYFHLIDEQNSEDSAACGVRYSKHFQQTLSVKLIGDYEIGL